MSGQAQEHPMSSLTQSHLQEYKHPEWASTIYLNEGGYPINKSFKQEQRYDPPETPSQQQRRNERR